MKKLIALSIVAATLPALVAGCSEEGERVTATTFHDLTVRRHSKVPFAKADAKAALDGASVIYTTDSDGAGQADVACDVRLRLSGDVGLFASATAPAVINNEAQMLAVDAEASHVKVVSAINWCGTAGPYNACADTPGRTLVVTSTTTYPGNVWGHEFGHNTGLPHRLNGTVRELMFGGGVTDGSVRVNAAECRSLIAGPGIASGATQFVPASQDLRGVANPLLAIAKSAFVDRIPYALIAKQDSRNLPAVIALLRNPAEQRYWPGAVTVIGIVGRPEDSNELVRLADGLATGPDAELQLRAQTAALLALGYLANRHESPDIVRFLLARAGADHWRASARRGAAAPDGDIIRYLREAALLGLALSGRPEALPHLTRDNATARDLAPGDDLRQAHQRISRIGLEGYYAE